MEDIINFYKQGIKLKKMTKNGRYPSSTDLDELYSKSIINFMNVLSLENEKFPQSDNKTYHLMALKNLEEIAKTIGHSEVLGVLRYLIGNFYNDGGSAIKI